MLKQNLGNSIVLVILHRKCFEVIMLNKPNSHSFYVYMSDWIKQLDSFLKLTNKDILKNTGTISHQKAIEKAHNEYNLYKEKIKNRISQVERDFIKQIENSTKKLKKS